MAERRTRRPVRVATAASLTVLVLWAGAAVWLSMPREGVCLAIWPAPPGCAPERPGFATAWFLATTALAAVLVATTKRVGSRSVVVTGVAGLVLVAALGLWLLWRI